MSSDNVPKKPDAGTRSSDHYKQRLPKWRLRMRNRLLVIVRAETPVLAQMQQDYRTPALDVFFAWTANLGTHTFFMVFLPICFFCGLNQLGRALVNMLASGVFVSGFIKDLLCLPRPMSPPLQRISKSHSAALEYGFPSTHSTNAVSVAAFALYSLHENRDTLEPAIYYGLTALATVYVISIVIGRLYCGMHGFFDVIVGSFLGIVLAVLQWIYGAGFQRWMITGPALNPAIVCLTILILVRVHPEPVDDCPCFDDSVAFAGVMMGTHVGYWYFNKSQYATDYPVPASIPFDFSQLGLSKAVARILVGVVLIFAWRGLMKPFLLRALPPVFRFVETLGLLLPRRYFLSATQYGRVPTLRKDDNVIPPASEIPNMIKALRHPRSRTVSVGPQSQADAYEAMAYRERRRRESRESLETPLLPTPISQEPPGKTSGTSYFINLPPPQRLIASEMVVTPAVEVAIEPFPPFETEEEEQKAEDEMFSLLLVPRVRYDVEVVTKLIIYTGIGAVATALSPFIFDFVGLGVVS